MPVLISEVIKDSPAHNAGVLPGETLVSINRHEINDVLDYRFYMTDSRLSLLIMSRDRLGTRTVRVKKDEYDELGLEFKTYLIDSQRTCKNKCIFCFIDQMPQGMRETLYFKDDDERMSFFFGNYITLTNLSEAEIKRIVKYRISPINVSIHTMDPELRVFMMKNPTAGRVLEYLSILKKAEIGINAQLVICPGINDGESLRQTLEKLMELLPALQSVSVVPVGLTNHREGLPPLTPFTREGAIETIGIVHEFAERCFKEWEDRIVYPSDELFLLASAPLPPYQYYGDFTQLENGVGMLSLLRQEFFDALEGIPEALVINEELSIATGVAAAPLIVELCEAVMRLVRGLRITVHIIPNRLFGDSVTVAGLLCGGDIFGALREKPLGARLLIPKVTLGASGERFLDDMPLEGLSGLLGVPVVPVENDGYALLDSILNM